MKTVKFLQVCLSTAILLFGIWRYYPPVLSANRNYTLKGKNSRECDCNLLLKRFLPASKRENLTESTIYIIIALRNLRVSMGDERGI